MEISDAWPGTYGGWGIHISVPTWNHSQISLAATEALSLKVSCHGTSLKWYKDAPSQHKNSYKLCNEMGHPIVNLIFSQWNPRQQHDQNFAMEGKPL